VGAFFRVTASRSPTKRDRPSEMPGSCPWPAAGSGRSPALADGGSGAAQIKSRVGYGAISRSQLSASAWRSGCQLAVVGGHRLTARCCRLRWQAERQQKTACSRSDLAGECRRSPRPAARVSFRRRTALLWNLTFGTRRTIAAQLAAAAAAQRLLPKGANWRCRPEAELQSRRMGAEKQTAIEQAFRRPCRTNRRSAQAVLSLAG